MVHIILIAVKQELIIHNLPIFDKSDAKKINDFIKNKTQEYGEIERVILSMGTVRIMDPKEEIPIPLPSARRI